MEDHKFIIRAALLYDFKLGKNAAESHRSIIKAFGEDAINKRQCQNWFQRFKSGNEDLHDQPRSGRPQEVVDADLLNAIEIDPSLSSRELAEMFNLDHGSILKHLHQLGKVNRTGKWVPHVLTQDNKNTRINVCSLLLQKCKSHDFFHRLLTSDETWIRYDNPKRKNQWLSSGQPPQTTPKPDIHGKKIMLCCWWNSNGLVHYELLKSGETVTSDLYVKQLIRVNEALKTLGLQPSRVRYLHDNAKPHTAKITHEKIEELGWKLLPHASYSPDLAPSDYFLFRSLKHYLEGIHFDDHGQVVKTLDNYFASKPPQFYSDGIRDLRRRWGHVIDNNGEYIVD